MVLRTLAFAATVGLMVPTPASADPWKDESGKHRERHGYYGGLPQGHLPPPGECRVWIPGVPAGQQPPPTDCRTARAQSYYHGGYVIRGKRHRAYEYGRYYDGGRYRKCDAKDFYKGEC